ncbi:MAG: phosphatase PAP2 family protein [Patescibacteria group bacterium]|nr:phosphatase PAP2 family protein [Patescibacteria group bacterium]
MNFYIFQQINSLAGQYIWLDALGIFFAEYFEFVLIFCLFLFLYNPIKKIIVCFSKLFLETRERSALEEERSDGKGLTLRSVSRWKRLKDRGFSRIFAIKEYWQSQMIVQAILAGVVSRLFFTEIIRFIIPNNRPFVENNVYKLISHSASSSFPSGHAAFYFAISGVVYFYNKKIGIIFFIASFLICLARIFCGIHWPADIVAGFVVGIFSSFLIIKLVKLIK